MEAITKLTAFRGFAGTSVLIIVGVATDTARKVRARAFLVARASRKTLAPASAQKCVVLGACCVRLQKRLCLRAASCREPMQI